MLALTLLVTALVGLTSGRPNNVRTSVVASQTDWTRGGSSQVSQAQGQAAANSIGVQTAPGFNQRDDRAANAAIALQGASVGNGDVSQAGGVTSETQGRLGNIGTLTTSVSNGRFNNAAATAALSGGAAAAQQVSQAGNLVAGGRTVGQRGANLNLATAGSVSTQTGSRGTGAFGNTNAVQTNAEHVGPLPAAGLPAAPGVILQGVGTPALGNLRTTPPPPPMPMMMMGGRGGHRD
ncbi:uncharacterized protein LOC122387879 [Amphibalanus amphitrite]|uniref:uncharacterized protein LOC122387879 n=1 Tax=Amphibalanus amphitrite TaxID=1232801 RepID=UPI001C92430C|nr:uncharacterized protein LOC122387879 [Amphibalanus amphitrite]